MRKSFVDDLKVDVIRELVEHGNCPNCGCDQWNTRGCPTCPVMRKAYNVLVELGEREPFQFAPYMDADEANRRNMRMRPELGMSRAQWNYLAAIEHIENAVREANEAVGHMFDAGGNGYQQAIREIDKLGELTFKLRALADNRKVEVQP